MADRYQADLDLAETHYKELNTDFQERSTLTKQGKQTGRVDYRMKQKHKQLMTEVVQLKKLLFLYEKNDDKYSSIKDKPKRIKKLKEFVDRSEKLQTDVNGTLQLKTQSSTINENQDTAEQNVLAQKKEYVRDEDGEYENTKGLD